VTWRGIIMLAGLAGAGLVVLRATGGSESASDYFAGFAGGAVALRIVTPKRAPPRRLTTKQRRQKLRQVRQRAHRRIQQRQAGHSK